MLACKDRSPSRPRLARLHAALARAWRGSSRFARTHWAQPRLSYEIRVGMRCKQSGLDRLEPWRGLLCLSRGVTVGRSHKVNNRVQALTRRVTADHAAHAAHAPGCSRRDFVVYAPRLVSTQNRNFSHFRFCHMCQIRPPIEASTVFETPSRRCTMPMYRYGSCVRPMHKKGSPLAGSRDRTAHQLPVSLCAPRPPLLYVCRANRDHVPGTIVRG